MNKKINSDNHFCFFSSLFSVEENREQKPVEDTSGEWTKVYSTPSESVPRTFIFFTIYQTANLVPICLQFFDVTFQDKTAKVALLPAADAFISLSLSLYNGLLPSPRLPAAACSSFVPFLWFSKAEAGCSWQGSAGQGTIKEAWERQLDLLPITLTRPGTNLLPPLIYLNQLLDLMYEDLQPWLQKGLGVSYFKSGKKKKKVLALFIHQHRKKLHGSKSAFWGITFCVRLQMAQRNVTEQDYKWLWEETVWNVCTANCDINRHWPPVSSVCVFGPPS